MKVFIFLTAKGQTERERSSRKKAITLTRRGDIIHVLSPKWINVKTNKHSLKVIKFVAISFYIFPNFYRVFIKIIFQCIMQLRVVLRFYS